MRVDSLEKDELILDDHELEDKYRMVINMNKIWKLIIIPIKRYIVMME